MKHRRFLPHACLLAVSILFLLPVGVMVTTSLKPMAEINSGSLFALPRQPTFEAWRAAWSTVPIGIECRGIGEAFLNSLRIAIPALVLSVVLGALTGMALYLKTSLLSRLLFGGLLASLFVPAQIAIYPILILLRMSGLYGNWSGVIWVQVLWGVPFLAVLFRNYFESIPRDIVRAAHVDGVGLLQLLWYVMIPLMQPILATAAVLQFTYLWNEFLLNLTFAPVGHQPVMVALNILAGGEFGSANYNINMAAAMFVALPSVLAYIFCGHILVRNVFTRSVRY